MADMGIMRGIQVLAVLACIVLASCGGSGSGGQTTSLQAAISFPPENAIVTQPTVMLSGTTDEGADALMVAGQAATSSDGFLTWIAQVPLVDGDNDLEIVVVKAGVSQIVGQRRVRFEPYVQHSLETMDVGQDNGLMYFSRSADFEYVLTLERPDGSRQFFDAIPIGTSLPLGGIAYDSLHGLIVFSTDGVNLQVYDLTNEAQLGAYNFVTGNEKIRSLELDTTTGDVFVATHSTGVGTASRIYRFAPPSGQATMIAGPFSPTSGSMFDHLCHDVANQYLYGYCFSQDRIYHVDVMTGVLTAIATGFQKMGLVTGLSLGPTPGRLQMVTDEGERIEVEIAGGQSSMVPRPNCDPPYFNQPQIMPPYLGICRDSSGSYLLQRQDRIIRVDGSGNCDEFFRIGHGESPFLDGLSFQYMAWDSLRQELIVNTQTDLYRLTASTGDLARIPGPTLGYYFQFIRPIRYDSLDDRIYHITATTAQGPGGVYSMPATGGEERLDVPLSSGFAAIDVDRDEDSGEYLVAITTTPTGPPTSIKVRRANAAGATIADFSITDSLVLNPGLLHVNAEDLSLFAWRQSPGELVRMTLPSFGGAPFFTYPQTFAQPLTMFYDHQRGEILTLLENRLTITTIPGGTSRDVLIAPEYNYPQINFRGLTRDLETGQIYVSSTNGLIVIIDPNTLATAILHF